MQALHREETGTLIVSTQIKFMATQTNVNLMQMTTYVPGGCGYIGEDTALVGDTRNIQVLWLQGLQ